MKKAFRRFIILVSVVLGLSVCIPAVLPCLYADAASTVYTFGVVPQFEQRKLHAIWYPIIKELERRTGFDFTLATTLNIQDFEKDFVKGIFDFVYMNPYHVLKANSSQGYIPLVRDKAPLRGILVVQKDSAIQKIADLNGKVIAFPSPNALGASLLMRADLERLHHIRVEPLYVRSHSSVYLHVAKGLTEAGGGVEKTLQEQDQTIRNSLRVIYTTRDMPSHPVVAHPRVPQALREKVRQALLDMGNTPEGRALLSRIPVRELIPASMDNYREMLGWGLKDYWDEFWKED
jgi:phosphonate transport system substrate-binding protein